jgi:hypothetical protein
VVALGGPVKISVRNLLELAALALIIIVILLLLGVI